MPKKSSITVGANGTIRFKGAAANDLMAYWRVEEYGARSHHGCSGPAREAALRVMAEKGIEPEPEMPNPKRAFNELLYEWNSLAKVYHLQGKTQMGELAEVCRQRLINTMEANDERFAAYVAEMAAYNERHPEPVEESKEIRCIRMLHATLQDLAPQLGRIVLQDYAQFNDGLILADEILSEN